MADSYRWSDPVMTAVTRAPDDPNYQISMDAAGNTPPPNGLAQKTRRADADASISPEVLVYGDKAGDE